MDYCVYYYFLKDIFDSIVMFVSCFGFWLNYSVIWNFEDFFEVLEDLEVFEDFEVEEVWNLF